MEWPSLLVLVALALTVLIGAVIQGAVGFGVALVSGPIVGLLDPTLVPDSLLVWGLTMGTIMVATHRRHIHWPAVGWAFLGRLPGTLIGLWLVAVLSKQTIGLVLSISVLLAVALTISKLTVPYNATSLTTAGFVSGVTGTAAGVGGPPVGIAMATQPGERVRGTLAMFFLLGSAVSMLTLLVGGQLSSRAMAIGLVIAPVCVFGYRMARPLRRFLDTGYFRAGVLTVSALSALVLLVQTLLSAG